MAFDELVSRRDAVAQVLELRSDWSAGTPESIATDAVAGRVLAESIVADRDVPARSHATMDGYAFDADQSYPFTIVDEVLPEGDPGSIEPEAAVKIATGAPVPAGATAVLKREDATVEDDELVDGPTLSPGTYVYERGSNVSTGETLFTAGEVLRAKDAILLGDLGYETVPVRPRLSVGLLATGTEIHEGRSADLDSPMLSGLIRNWGHEPHLAGTVPDDFDTVVARIDNLARAHDVVMTTGGTSVGRKDYVLRALAKLGTVHFHGVAIRPGKPIGVATLPDHDAVAFAIPGKPIGAYTITTAVARPFFTGETALPQIEAAFACDLDVPRTGFEYWIPVTLDDETAVPLGHADSALPVFEETFSPSVLSSSTRASRADGVVITEERLAAGEAVGVVPYEVFE